MQHVYSISERAVSSLLARYVHGCMSEDKATLGNEG